MPLNVTRLTLYKHGLGFFERSGEADASFTLDFPRRSMDDVLKSLTVVPSGATVRSIAFETPGDRNPAAQRQPLHLDPGRPLSSVLDAFTGRRVSVSVGDRTVQGELVGLEREDSDHLERALLSVLTSEGIRLLPLSAATQIALLDDDANGDLRFALDAQRLDADRANARVTMSDAASVRLSYIAPAPAWRVSYRVLLEAPDGDGDRSPVEQAPGEQAPGEGRRVFLQGWGVFDNTLEEDLKDITLTLTAGMPVSFRYDLHQPNTPDRPTVHDEERTVRAPIEFAAMSPMMAAGGFADAAPPMAAKMAAPGGRQRPVTTSAELMEAAPSQATTDSRGALFAYEISDPVSVRRGESGMVPILASTTPGTRELLYNPAKNADHPVSSVRFTNGPLTLERGPAIVLEHGDYAGEAIVPYTSGGTGVILAFAVELGIGVRLRSSTREETTSLRVRDGSLFIGVVDHHETTYHVDSTLDKPCVLTIEHPRTPYTDLLTAPVESTVEVARFKCPVVGHGTAAFTVEEKRERTSVESVHGLDGRRLQAFLDGRVVDQATFAALSGVLDLLARIADLEQQANATEEQREGIRERLDDTRKNLEPLDPVHDSALRARFTGQLESLEDRMLAYDLQDDQRTEEIGRLVGQVDSELRRLSGSDPVTGS